MATFQIPDHDISIVEHAIEFALNQIDADDSPEAIGIGDDDNRSLRTVDVLQGFSSALEEKREELGRDY